MSTDAWAGSVIGAVVAEWFSGDRGLGSVIYIANNNLASALITAGRYDEAKKHLDAAEAPDVAASLAKRSSPGACGNLMLDRIRQRLEQQMSKAAEYSS